MSLLRLVAALVWGTLWAALFIALVARDAARAQTEGHRLSTILRRARPLVVALALVAPARIEGGTVFASILAFVAARDVLLWRSSRAR